MYTIVGGDQKEYGPVEADVLRQWIAQGRANRATRVRIDSDPNWNVLGELPEFGEALGAQDKPPAVADLAVPPPAGSLPTVEDFRERGKQIDIMRCLGLGWEILRSRFWLLVGASALLLLIQTVVDFIPAVGWIVSAALPFVIWGGLDWLCLKLVRRQPAELADALSGFRINFVQLLVGGIVSTVLIIIGLALLIIPGLYLLMAWYSFAPLLMMDKGMDFWPALELSRKAVTANLGVMIGFFAMALLILIGGALACLVGLFVAIPWISAAYVYAYEILFSAAPAETA